MNRRRFLKVSAITAGSLAIGGGVAYSTTRDSDILDDHFAGTEKVLVNRFGKGRSTGLMKDIQQEYEALAPEIPYIEGVGTIQDAGRRG